MKKRPLSTLLSSAIQATDSTFMGCSAKSAATKALLSGASVMFLRARKSRTAFAMCRQSMRMWNTLAVRPKNSKNTV